MPSNALFVHVPVDKVRILRGPHMRRCLEIRELFIWEHKIEYVEESFTLATPASTRSFRRTLKLTSLTSAEFYQFNLTALFSGQIVSGIYDARARAGWFSLD